MDVRLYAGDRLVVDGATHDAGGPQILEECRRIRADAFVAAVGE